MEKKLYINQKHIMTIAKGLLLMSIFATIFWGALYQSSFNSSAKELLDKGTLSLFADEEDDDDNEIEFVIPDDGYAYIEFTVAIDDYTGISKELRFFLNFYKEVRSDDDYDYDYELEYVDRFLSILDSDSGSYSGWCYIELDAGIYDLLLTSNIPDYESYSFKYKIYYYNSYTTSLTFPSSITVTTDNSKNIELTNIEPSGSLNGATVESSNSEIAYAVNNGHDNVVTVYGVRAGKCTITLTLQNGVEYKCIVTVKDGKPIINYYSYTMQKGETVKLEIYQNSKKVKWSSSNKSIATVSSSGKVKAKGVGTCTITAKIGSKKRTCKIKVTHKSPNFYGRLTSYNTRDNYFVVKIKNYGDKTLKIKSGINVENSKYKSFDRTVYLKSPVSIAPGKTANVKFYVKGSTTWYDHDQYTLEYKFSYDGVTYLAHVWHSNSVFKKGSKWYYTKL